MIRIFQILLFSSVFPVSAMAASDCAWGDEPIERITANMTSVSINGEFFVVKGPMARQEFIAEMNACDVDPAVLRQFKKWRSMRRATNITFGVGFTPLPFAFGLPWLATPVTAIMAGVHKNQMVGALRRSERKREREEEKVASTQQ